MRKPRLEQEDRRHSWPTFKVNLSHRKKDIDDDPFSFFISPPEDDCKQGSENHLDADIEPGTRPRSLSPRISQNKEKLLQSPAISRLRRWVQKMESRYLHLKHQTPTPEITFLLTPPDSPVTAQTIGVKRPASPDEDSEPNLDIVDITVSPPLRGRRPTRTSRRRYGDKMVRSHSKRARVWKEPNEDIWPVLEEPEEIGLGIRV